MKINLNSIGGDFYKKEGIFCGREAILVTPKLSAKWDSSNVIYRSSIWDLNGNLLSAGLKKFKNASEDEENFPTPKDLRGCSIYEKWDGSLLISDYIEGELSFRTRGTFSSLDLDNASDFEEIKERYPQISDWHKANPNFSLLFEITSPNQKIVINYGPQVDICLIGAVDKNDYSYLRQLELDYIGKGWKFKRPASYSFESIEEMKVVVLALEGKEGVCVYHSNDQKIFKVKAAKYLMLHHFKSEISSIDKIVELWHELDMPDYNKLYNYICEQYDWELAEMARAFISKTCDAAKEVERIIAGFNSFLTKNDLFNKTDKEAWFKVVESYGATNRAGYLMKLKKGKNLEKDDYKKLILQVLK